LKTKKKMKKISESDLMRSDKTLLQTYRKEEGEEEEQSFAKIVNFILNRTD